MTATLRFSALLQDYFYQRLIAQRNVSARTVSSYRDTFRLLLDFAQTHYRRPVTTFTLADLNAKLILAFLDHIERDRHNCARSRNARLAAIHSFAHYAAVQEPAALHTLSAVIALPTKRFDRAAPGFLSREEIQALLDAPDSRSFSGRRDRVLLATLYNTGARVSEMAAARRADLQWHPTPCLLLHGKGRKERVVPLWKSTAALLRLWLREIDPDTDTPLFPNRFGKPMTRAGIEHRLAVTVLRAAPQCPSLRRRRISPHVFRHSVALHLLQSGVDLTVIGLWLGHESVQTTHHYVEANLAMKQKALATLGSPQVPMRRYRAPQDLLGFLEQLNYAQ